MKHPSVDRLARQGILFIDGVLLVVTSWVSFCFVGIFVTSSGSWPSFGEQASAYVIFLTAPLTILLSTLRIFRWQWRVSRPAYVPFFLSFLAHATLAHSWGMHSRIVLSVAFALTAMALSFCAVIGYLRSQRKIRNTPTTSKEWVTGRVQGEYGVER